MNGNSEGVTVGGAAGTASVSIAGGTATITSPRPPRSRPPQAQALVDSLAYDNNDNTPTATTHTISVTSLTDNGANGGPNGDDNTGSPSVSTVVTVVADQRRAGRRRRDLQRHRHAAIVNTSLVVNDAADLGAPDPAGPQKTITGDLLAGDTDVEPRVHSWTDHGVTDAPTTDAAARSPFEAGRRLHLPVLHAGFTGNVFTYTMSTTTTRSAASPTPATITINVATPKVWYVDANAGRRRRRHLGQSVQFARGAQRRHRRRHHQRRRRRRQRHHLPLRRHLYGRHRARGRPAAHQPRATASPSTAPRWKPPSGSRYGRQRHRDAGNSGRNTIQGIDFGNSAGFALSGINVGNATVNTVTAGLINNTTGGAISITNGTFNATFSSIASNGGAQGIQLVNVDNSIFGVTGITTIDDATTAGIAVSTSQNSTFTFGGKVTILNDGGANGDGVDLQNNNAGDSTFHFNGGVDIEVNGANAFGFRAQSSGIVNILDPGGNTNEIISNNGTAILINPTQFNAALDLVRSTGDSGTDGGINLDGMTGTLTIESVDIDGQDGDGIDILNTNGSVTINGGTHRLRQRSRRHRRRHPGRHRQRHHRRHDQ